MILSHETKLAEQGFRVSRRSEKFINFLNKTSRSYNFFSLIYGKNWRKPIVEKLNQIQSTNIRSHSELIRKAIRELITSQISSAKAFLSGHQKLDKIYGWPVAL